MYITADELSELLFRLSPDGDYILTWHRGFIYFRVKYIPGSMTENLRLDSYDYESNLFNVFYFTVKSFQQLKYIIDAI